MTEIIVAALNKLDADPMNVRKTYTTESLEGLAASLLAKANCKTSSFVRLPRAAFTSRPVVAVVPPSCCWPSVARSLMTSASMPS